MSRELLTITQLAQRTGLPQDTIRGHLKRGEWPGIRVGIRKAWRVPIIVLDAISQGVDPARLKRASEREFALIIAR